MIDRSIAVINREQVLQGTRTRLDHRFHQRILQSIHRLWVMFGRLVLALASLRFTAYFFDFGAHVAVVWIQRIVNRLGTDWILNNVWASLLNEVAGGRFLFTDCDGGELRVQFVGYLFFQHFRFHVCHHIHYAELRGRQFAFAVRALEFIFRVVHFVTLDLLVH